MQYPYKENNYHTKNLKKPDPESEMEDLLLINDVHYLEIIKLYNIVWSRSI